MLQNYLTIALRNFRRQPGYTFLNILGLTIGISATLLILLYLTVETSFDSHHERGDRIFRVSSDITEPDDHFRWSVTQMPLALQLKTDYPEVEQFVRFIPNGRAQLQYQDNIFFEEKSFLVDSTLFEVFSLNLLKGDPATALKEPNSITLSASAAKRIFGKVEPLGEFLKTGRGTEYKVTGIFEDMPTSSHLIADVLFSANSVARFMNPNPGSWGGFNMYSYVLLREGADPDAFEAKLPEVIEKHVAVIFDEFDIKVKYELLALKDIHLKSDFEGEAEPAGEIGFLYIFGAVGLFMLLIAIINYMNLSTARATKRAMEVGIRKVLGSERKQLIAQFLSESIIFTLLALLLSFGIVHLMLPIFNETFDLTLNPDLLTSQPVLLGALAIVLLTGVLGGSYPAFYLSKFQPIAVLKGSKSKGSGNPKLRKALVMVQFAITIFMIIGTGIIYDQMNYLRTKNLGFDKENVLTLQMPFALANEKYPVLREKLLQNPKITAVGTANATPGEGSGKQLMNVENSTGVMEQYGVDNYGVDFDFFPTLGMEIVAGRHFSSDFGTDTTLAVLVNEAMVERMGWSAQDAIGRKVQYGTNDTLPVARVIGVVKDFHQRSLYEPITALLFRPSMNNYQVHARINPENPKELSEAISFAERAWREVFPGNPFEFDFVDSAFMELYKADQIRASIFTLFSVLMILIACLGLLGLASFSSEQRTKEIGVRKIMGAGTTDIVYLLTRNFIFLVALATLPAFIAAWYFMTRWLDTFTYHASMNYWLYGLAFLLVVLITLVTTGYHALRAAKRNPVEALRYE